MIFARVVGICTREEENGFRIIVLRNEALKFHSRATRNLEI